MSKNRHGKTHVHRNRSEIRHAAMNMMRYSGYTRKIGRPTAGALQGKQLIRALMEKYSISRSTVLRAIKGLTIPGIGPNSAAAIYPANTKTAHSSVHGGVANSQAIDVDLELKSALVNWMKLSKAKTQATISLAKELYESID